MRMITTGVALKNGHALPKALPPLAHAARTQSLSHLATRSIQIGFYHQPERIFVRTVLYHMPRGIKMRIQKKKRKITWRDL
jgi:hypothetical protein